MDSSVFKVDVSKSSIHRDSVKRGYILSYVDVYLNICTTLDRVFTLCINSTMYNGRLLNPQVE
uniref:Uncharacterized protein n=1 Tax=Lepeophtheirus salmonis TaxID=72036 RepID=A0A0K2V5E5_LEPSM